MKNAKTPKEVKPLPAVAGTSDPLGSLDTKLREDPLPDPDGMEIGFDSHGPKAKKIKNTYTI